MDTISVNELHFDGNEKKYLAECIDTGWVSSDGPFVKRFEEGMAARLGRRHGIAVSNGTAALDIAVMALGIGAGDEVVLPTFTIISCAAAIVRAGATPVVVDSDALTWNMRVDQIEKCITDRTRAIMAVHIYGMPVDMDPLLALAEKYKLPVIEDAAEAIGQTYNGKSCGGLGTISTLSFYANKQVTTGEGGMVLTDDDALAKRCREYRNLCFGVHHRFEHENLGWNFRMSNLQAAVGVAQLEILDQTVKKKREIGSWYEASFDGIQGIERSPKNMSYAQNIWWVYGIVLDDSVGFDAVEAMRRLAVRGIGTRPFFWPMHEQPVLLRMGLFQGSSHPVAERIARRGFYLPSGVSLSQEQLARVASCVKELLV